jgi:hypothetical protein
MNQSNLFKGIHFSIRSSLKLLGIWTVFFMVSCNGGAKTEKTNSDSANLLDSPMRKQSEIQSKHVDEDSMHQSKAFSCFFYNLKLSKPVLQKIFNEFKTPKKSDKLVLQFYYPKQPSGGSPTLGAYALRSKNQAIDPTQKPTFELLDYVDESSEPLIGRPQFLGDQQLDVDELKQLIKDSNKPDPMVFDHLLFSVKFDNSNPHIYYEVSVVPSNQFKQSFLSSIDTDPSPPASAR